MRIPTLRYLTLKHFQLGITLAILAFIGNAIALVVVTYGLERRND